MGVSLNDDSSHHAPLLRFAEHDQQRHVAAYRQPGGPRGRRCNRLFAGLDSRAEVTRNASLPETKAPESQTLLVCFVAPVRKPRMALAVHGPPPPSASLFLVLFAAPFL